MKYLDKVSNEEFVYFLKKNDIEPGAFFDKEGNLLPVIERFEKFVIFRGRLKNNEFDKIVKSFSFFRAMGTMNPNGFDLDSCLVIFDDYSAMTDYRNDLQDAYAHFMYDKFGEEYREDYNARITSERNETKENNDNLSEAEEKERDM